MTSSYLPLLKGLDIPGRREYHKDSAQGALLLSLRGVRVERVPKSVLLGNVGIVWGITFKGAK